MGTPEMPRIGNHSDAIELLKRLIKLAKANNKKSKTLIMGLEALKDVIVREAI